MLGLPGLTKIRDKRKKVIDVGKGIVNRLQGIVKGDYWRGGRIDGIYCNNVI